MTSTSTSTGSPTTSTSGTPPIPQHGESPGKSGYRVPPLEVMLNLTEALVRRAILDAHPESPLSELEKDASPELVRSEARQWVEHLFRNKPTNLERAKSVWKK